MPCPVCNHDNRGSIDERLAQGANLAQLAQFFGISEAVFRKHQSEHLRGVAIRMRTDPTSPLADLQFLSDKLRTQIELAEGLRDAAGNFVSKPDKRAAIAAISEMRHVTMAQLSAAKELRMFKDDVVSKDQLKTVVDRVISALADFPDALDAVKMALEDLE